MTTISVLLVDDHTVVRSGLKALLGTQADIVVVGEAASGEEALEAAQQHSPAVILMDLAMGAGMDGMEAIKQLRQRNPRQALIVFTTYDSDGGGTAPGSKPRPSSNTSRVIASGRYPRVTLALSAWA